MVNLYLKLVKVKGLPCVGAFLTETGLIFLGVWTALLSTFSMLSPWSRDPGFCKKIIFQAEM